MMKFVHSLRATLEPLLRRRPEFVPAFDDAFFFDLLARAVCAGHASGLTGAVSAWEDAQHLSAAQRAAAYFASRQTPRFFADPAALLGAPDATLARWIEVATHETVRMTTEVIRIYGLAAPPLRPGFPWADPVSEARSDLLFAVHPQRFQFLPRFALAAATGGYSLPDMGALLDDWMAFAPTRPDLAFCSNLVVSQRLLATTWAIAFLGAGGASSEACRFRLLRVLATDVRFLWPRLGDSHPNNHLLADRFVAWYIALLFPEFLPRRPKLSVQANAFADELLRQTYADGGGIEHSVHYHGLGAEMGAAFLLLSKRNDHNVPSTVRERIGRMLHVQSTLAGPDGHAPDIGDSSDDPLFPLDGGLPGNEAALREIYRAVFAPDMKPLVDSHLARERAFWMLGGQLAPQPTHATPAATLELPQGGIVVFCDDGEMTRCVFRVGPVAGTRYLSGHMHEDALSITLVRNGVPTLVEAGTCTYRHRPSTTAGAPGWREFFAGPRAHNGLVGHQPRYGSRRGDFRADSRLPEARWSARAAGANLAFFEASLAAIDGIPTWTRGVIHLRGAGFIVYDILAHDHERDLHFAFQWGEGAELSAVDRRALIAVRSGIATQLAWSAGLGAPEIVTGRLQPPNGWISPRYGERVAAPQLLIPVTGTTALTAFAIDNGATRGLSLQCAQPSSHARAFSLSHGGDSDIVLVNAGALNADVTAFGCTFRGRIVWIRVPDGGEPSVRWLDGAACELAAHRVHHRLREHTAEFSG